MSFLLYVWQRLTGGGHIGWMHPFRASGQARGAESVQHTSHAIAIVVVMVVVVLIVILVIVVVIVMVVVIVIVIVVV